MRYPLVRVPTLARRKFLVTSLCYTYPHTQYCTIPGYCGVCGPALVRYPLVRVPTLVRCKSLVTTLCYTYIHNTVPRHPGKLRGPTLVLVLMSGKAPHARAPYNTGACVHGATTPHLVSYDHGGGSAPRSRKLIDRGTDGGRI